MSTLATKGTSHLILNNADNQCVFDDPELPCALCAEKGFQCGAKLPGPKTQTEYSRPGITSIPGTTVFKLPRPLHIPDALRVGSIDVEMFFKRRKCHGPHLVITPVFCYIFGFSGLHEDRLSSVVEYAPLRYATLAYLEVAKVGVVTVNALSFLDQFYVHTRDILAKPVHINLMHAAILVLCVLQVDGTDRKCALSMDVAEKELLFISMIVRCFNSSERPAHSETGWRFSWLLQGCMLRLFNLPFAVSLPLLDAIQFFHRIFESVPPPLPQNIWPCYPDILPVCFHFIKYVESCQAESWLGKRVVRSARESLSSAFSELLESKPRPIRTRVDRGNYYLFSDYEIDMIAAIRTILQDAPSGRRNIAKIEAAKWLMLPRQFDSKWEGDLRMITTFFAGLILTPTSFPDGTPSRQR